jgi:5-hydroxyisourate hydrolase-like protein (transthyretin family)
MRLAARLWLCLAPVLLLTLTANGQTPIKTTKVVLTTISGKVTFKDKPAQGVAVMLRRSEAFTNNFDDLPRGKTGDDGTYQIVNVAPGSYEVSPSAPAYVAGGGGRSRTVVVGEGEVIENINFSLVKGGVVTGKVVDADGRPVIAHQVSLFRADAWDVRQQQMQQQQRGSTPARPNPIFQSGAAMTDDRGVYRMFGLQPGKYKVGVGRGEETFTASISTGQRSFRQVFHPDVTDQAKATIIEVSEGSEATGIDVTLGRPVQTYTASGLIVDGESGSPMPGMRFALQRMRADRPEFVSSFVASNSDGQFTAEGLLAGKYSAVVMPEPNVEVRAEPLTFDIIDQDITGLTIRINKGASITGVVVIENENQAATAQLAKAIISAYVANPNIVGGLGQGATSQINADGSFRVGGLPAGMAVLNVSSRQGEFTRSGSFFQVRLERDGVVQARGIELREGEQATGVRLVVSLGTATIRGAIKVNGEMPENVNFYVRINRNGEQFTGVMPPRVDSRGRFAIEGLPPGQYELSASVTSPTMRSRAPATQQVTVVDGGVHNLELTVELMAVQPRP